MINLIGVLKAWDRSELLEINNNKKKKIILIFLKVIIGLNLKRYKRSYRNKR